MENLLNEAALLAARRNKRLISMEDIEDSFLKVIMGTEKKSRVMTDREKRLTAYHEAGHAIATRCLPTQDPVHTISIIPARPRRRLYDESAAGREVLRIQE